MTLGQNKGQIIVAVLGFTGIVVTTVSSNWDKWFPRSAPTPIVTPTQLVSATPPDITTPSDTTTPQDPTPRVIPTPRVTPFLLHTPNPRVTPTQSDITTPSDPTPLPAKPSPRVTAPQPDTPTPPASPAPRVTAIPSGTPTLLDNPTLRVSPSPRITPTPPATTAPPAMITASATPTRIMSPRPGATVGQKIAVEGILAGLRPDEHVFLCVKSQAFGRLIYPQGQVIPDETGQWTVVSIYGTPGYRYETFLVSTTNAASAALLSMQHARKYGMRELPPGTERLGTAIVVTRE